jgi:predicted secreted protein
VAFLKRGFIIFGLLTILSTPVFAGEVASRKILGFSQDGTYLAWEESITYEESLFQKCTIYFIRVPKNAWAAKPVEATRPSDISESSEHPCKTAHKKAQANFNKLGIKTEGSTKPYSVWWRVVHHELSEVFPPSQKSVLPTADKENVRFNVYLSPPFSLFYTNFAEIKLQQLKAPGSKEESDAKMLRLALLVDGKKIILQNDKKLPNSRKAISPIGYRIGEVYLHQNEYFGDTFNIVVFLDMFVPAVEGPSRRTLAVTGRFTVKKPN